MLNFRTPDPVHFNVSSSILWIIFCLALIVFSVMSLIYIYHWRNYGTGNKVITRMEVVYTLVGLVLLGLSAFAILTH